VIQRFSPLRVQPSGASSARVARSVAAEPASGSVMAMAGFSPSSSTHGKYRRFWASVP
jgi:hypothetical protein